MIAPPEFDSVETDRLLDMAFTVTVWPDAGAARLLPLSEAAVTVDFAVASMFAESALSPSEMLSVSASAWTLSVVKLVPSKLWKASTLTSPPVLFTLPVTSVETLVWSVALTLMKLPENPRESCSDWYSA